MDRFPDTFMFGATIGAHQVEGHDFESDWWRWEQRPSRIADGSTSEHGAGHLERYAQDLSLARKMGHNSVCLSFSWPRIQPAQDRFDAEALDHYRKVLEHAAALGLTPVCILHQVALPEWFCKRGGWNARDGAELFQAYAKAVADALGTLCRWWIPVYEPEYWLTLACREKRWPHEKATRAGYRSALNQLVQAQCRAAAVLLERNGDAMVGVSVRAAIVEPFDRHSPWDLRAAHYEQKRLNMRFIEAVTAESPEHLHFIGLSYYGKLRVRFAPLYLRGGCALPVDEGGNPAGIDDVTACADGFEEVLSMFASLKRPLLLTGLGIASEMDLERRLFLCDHVQALLRGMHSFDGGPDVRALFYASLLDGFEWHHGYSRRYGLIHVKHPGLERTPNESAWFFKDIAEHGHVRPGAIHRFCKNE